jgi:hypothetical protein
LFWLREHARQRPDVIAISMRALRACRPASLASGPGERRPMARLQSCVVSHAGVKARKVRLIETDTVIP